MCGRYTLSHRPREVSDHFDVDADLDFPPRFNIAPSQQVVAVVSGEGGRRLDHLNWGLVPRWTRDLATARRPINARAETLLEKPTFREAVRRGRCLIPASGFYEWRREGRTKQPFYIRRKDGGLFAFAGLCDVWRGREGDSARSCCIVTTTPNQLMAPIHDRMPCILMPGDEAAWLDVLGVIGAEALALIRPYPDEDLEANPVSTRVNSPANDGPDLVAAVA